MGHIRNQCIVVSTWDLKRLRKARKSAVAIFELHNLPELVGPVVQHAINGGGTFLISPDGSKEGWDHSDRGKDARAEYIAFLKGAHDLYLDWALIELGGDDGRFCVLSSPNGEEAAASREPA